MKIRYWGILLLAACMLGSCTDPVVYDPSRAADIYNVNYGSDPQQNMDIYLPANRTLQTKTIVLVHGGGWTSGSKEDFNYSIPFFKTYLSSYAVVNINYRLGTTGIPGTLSRSMIFNR